MLPHEKEKIKRRLDFIIGDKKLSERFRERYATEFNIIRAAIDGDLIKDEAVRFIMELTRNKVLPKKTYVATITFEYDGDEPLPFSGKEITHLDDIIQEVKDEIEEFGSTLNVEASEYIDGELNYKITG